MDRLAQTLERFNRKERNLLIRHALGHKEAALRLSAKFRQQVSNALGIAPIIPENAWWATDYHINWLAGALVVYIEGETTIDKPWPNEPVERHRLIEGNQEDVDLIIAWGNELILIEAKAYGIFGNAPIASKFARLNLLQTYCKTLPHESEHPVRFHLMLVSLKEPQKRTPNWPEWARKGTEIPWIPLELDASTSVLNVTRCNQGGTSTAAGNHWQVFRHGRRQKLRVVR